ncbi:MAG: hypothetical protein IPM46_14795 [Flavobacteriales bacterium]|nr:hypothetical protein [Flavobacteriales bacterium]
MLVHATACGQERFGITHSNFGGADATYLNPARGAGQWPFADVRLLGADLFAWNSLVAWGNRDQRLVGELRSGIAGTTGGELVLRDASGNNRAFIQANVLGPGFSIALGRGTIGAGIRARTAISVTGVSSPLGNFIFHGFGYAPQHGIRYQDDRLRAVGAAWTEFGINYAHILKAEGFSMLSAGIGLKYNLGHAAGALQIDAIDYTVLDTSRLVVHEASARYGFAMPAIQAGGGLGADIGIVYERTLEEADGYMPHRSSGGCDPLRYRYRIGASLIDLGGIRFRNGVAGTISTGSLHIADYNRVPVNDVDDLDSLFATSTNWSREQGLSVGLPTAASLQVDYRIAGNACLALAAVQQVSGRGGLRIRRANALALTPRFETRYFEVAAPIVLHEYTLTHPSIGFMIRLDGVVIGSDHILPFLNRRDVHAADIYFRIRWMIFRSPFCKGKRSRPGPHRIGGRDMIPCATPND